MAEVAEAKKTRRIKRDVEIDINTKVWLTTEELAAYLGFGSETLFRNWRNEGLLTFYKPGVILYKRADVDAFISNYEFKKF